MRVVVAAWVGSNNLGDELIFRALLDLLSKHGVPRGQVTAISKDPEKTAKLFHVKSIWHFNAMAIAGAVKSADLVVFGGGGILQDITSIWNLPYHLSRIWISKLLGTPILAIGIGVGPLETRLGRWFTKVSLGYVPDILVRDQASQDELSEIGVLHSTVGADLAWSLSPLQQSRQSYIAACLRPHAPRRGLLPVSMRKQVFDPSYIQSIASALDAASRKVSSPIRFIAFDKDKDVEFHRAISKKMATDCSFSDVTVDTVISELGAAEVVIAMRYHAGVVATLAGRPSLLISDSPKVKSLASALGEACRIIPNEQSSFYLIPGLTEELWNKGSLVESSRRTSVSASKANHEMLGRITGC